MIKWKGSHHVRPRIRWSKFIDSTVWCPGSASSAVIHGISCFTTLTRLDNIVLRTIIPNAHVGMAPKMQSTFPWNLQTTERSEQFWKEKLRDTLHLQLTTEEGGGGRDTLLRSGETTTIACSITPLPPWIYFTSENSIWRSAKPKPL